MDQDTTERPGAAVQPPAAGTAHADPRAIDTPRPLIQSLAARLLRAVSGAFLVISVLLLGTEVALEYRHAEHLLVAHLDAMQATFGPGIADAAWGLNEDVLNAILAGMKQLPEVVGVKVVDEQGRQIAAVGTIIDQIGFLTRVDPQGRPLPGIPTIGLLDRVFGRTFDTIHVDGQGGRHAIGQWSVYASRRFIVDEVEQQLMVLCVIAAAKTAALWVIFLVVIQRVIGRPLRAISAHVAQLDIENLGHRPFVLNDPGHHELHILADTLNRMAAKIRREMDDNDRLLRDLQELNATLYSKVQERTQELHRVATSDSLTGLPNRRRMEEVLSQAFQRLERFGGSLSVIVADVDHFKSVNDVHGHQIGDLVLVTIAKALAQNARGTDTVGRWGGEEFLVVCPDADVDGALLVAERLRQRVAAVELPPAIGPKTCSFGVAQAMPGEKADQLLARADDALYRAKHAGRNRVEAAAQS